MKRLVCLLVLWLPWLSLADPPRTTVQPGVNWEGQVLRATGGGAPDLKAATPAQARLGAETAAKLDAFRQLLSQAKGIQISAGKTVGDAMASDEVKARVEGVIRGYRIAGKRYYSDGGVEIDVEVPLAGLAELFAPAAAPQPPNAEGEPTNTGLVVDARGLKVTKALAPRLLDAAGKAIYGIDSLSEEARKSRAVAAYFPSPEAAQKSLLVGDRPLVVKASKAEGTDLVLSAEDLQRLAGSNASYLAEGRVAIITN